MQRFLLQAHTPLVAARSLVCVPQWEWSSGRQIFKRLAATPQLLIEMVVGASAGFCVAEMSSIFDKVEFN